MTENLSLKRQHISVQIYTGYFRYLKKNYPHINIQQLVTECGLTWEHMQNPQNWVSTVFDRRLTLRIIEATGDSDISYNTGRMSISKETLPSLIYIGTQILGSTALIFEKINESTGILNKVLHVHTLSRAKGRKSIEIRPNVTGLEPEEITALKDNFPEIIKSASGYYSAFPRILSCADARVSSELGSSADGLPFCRMTIEYRDQQNMPRSLTYLAAIIIGILLFFVSKKYDSSAIIAHILLGVSPLFMNFLFWQRLSQKMLKREFGDVEQNHKLLESNYRNLQILTESLARRDAEQKIINSLIETLLSADTEDTIFSESCKIIVEHLNFDRAIILYRNTESQTLDFAYGYSSVPGSLDAIKELHLPLNIESDDPSKFSNVFRLRRPLLVENIENYENALSEEGAAFVRASGTHSFVCVPIVSNQVCFGLLIVDAFLMKKTLNKDDLELALNIARPLAVAVSKIELIKGKMQALQTSNQFKDQILANTSHELRTPLFGIIGLTQSVLDGLTGPISSDAKAALNSVVQSGNRLARIVDDILETSQANHSALQMKIIPINIRPICERVMRIFSTQAREKGLSLKLEGVSSEWRILADEGRLEQILSNLIANGIKFTDQGTVTLSAHLANATVEFRVRDSGIGIPENRISELFAPFSKGLHADKRQLKGTGLGLSICKTLVELQQGKISVESEPFKGTSVIFTLPFSHIEEAPAFAESFEDSFISDLTVMDGTETEIDVQAPHTISIPKVFLVDDESINLQTLKLYLKDSGFELETFSDGLDALSAISKGNIPQLILLDVMMERCSGFDICAEIRKKHRGTDLPIIFMTAKSSEEDIVKGLEVGGNDYVTKPFSPKVLNARMRSQLAIVQFTFAYSRFVPWEMLDLMGMTDILKISIGQSRWEKLTILFLDIRNYTELSDSMGRDDTLRFLNSFLGHSAPIVATHRGVIDKYIGDCIMAIFRDPNDAVNAAIDLQKAIPKYNDAHRSGGRRRPISSGIGLHEGYVSVGPIGSAERMDLTVVSGAVNTAARIQEYTKTVGAQILISGAVFDSLHKHESLLTQCVGPVSLRGLHNEIDLYEVFLSEKAMSDGIVRLNASALFQDRCDAN